MAVRILDRSLSRLPTPLRTLIDWALTITLAVGRRADLSSRSREAVSDPLRVHGADPPLRQAGRRLQVASLRPSHRQPTRLPVPRARTRRHHRLQDATQVKAACHAGGTFIKRIVGLPGEAVSMRAGQVFIDGARLAEPYLRPAYRGRRAAVGDAPEQRVLRPGRQPSKVL